MKINYKVLIFSFVIVFLVAFVGSLFTSADTEWYESIKPAITPPNYVFPIVWNILFGLIAVSLCLAWTNSNKKEKFKVMILFGFNLFLNVLWSAIFFGMKNPFFAFFELILLWFSIVLMIAITYKINKFSGYLLIPYLVWVTFAGVLNYLIVF